MQEIIEIIIDEEFKSLLPALDPETYAMLEESLLEHGCRDALVLWNGILIDGHNRFEICTRLGIPFKTVDMEFAGRDDVLIWIISTQVARRNLTPLQLSNYRGLHYRADKKIQGAGRWAGQGLEDGKKVQNEPFTNSTASRLAEKYNVSRSTIKRDAHVSHALEAIAEASPEARRMILDGEVSVNKRILEALPSWPKEEVAELALRIEEGRYERRQADAAVAPAAFEASVLAAEAESAGFADASPAVMRPFEAAIAKITDELFSELRKHVKEGDPAELRTALRTYINMLEDMYRRI